MSLHPLSTASIDPVFALFPLSVSIERCAGCPPRFCKRSHALFRSSLPFCLAPPLFSPCRCRPPSSPAQSSLPHSVTGVLPAERPLRDTYCCIGAVLLRFWLQFICLGGVYSCFVSICSVQQTKYSKMYVP